MPLVQQLSVSPLLRLRSPTLSNANNSSLQPKTSSQVERMVISTAKT